MSFSLPPGESVQMEFSLPPHIAKKMEDGGLFSVIEGPIERVQKGKFKRKLDIYIDSEREATISLEWEESEPWYLFLARRVGFCDRNKQGGPRLDGYQCQRVSGGASWTRADRKAKALHAQCDAFNASTPVGSKVFVRNYRGTGVSVITWTASKAQVLSGHTAVIWLEGISGCYPLDRVSKVIASFRREGGKLVQAGGSQ